ncbi:MAG: phage major capsid protein [Solidesulfovibrio sp.]|uniref:phage major capsid protein n=1 Tax=Solidesulfovibrio sp. TaxID=2910990 RepID=UPI003158EBAB
MEAEIKSLIEQQGQAFLDFKAKHDGDIEQLSAAMDELFKKANRPPAAGGGSWRGDEIKSKLASYIKSGDMSLFGQKALTTATDSGGVVVPKQLASEIVNLQQKYSPLRSVCRVVQIETLASNYSQPVNTGGVDSGWVGEVDARPATNTPNLSNVDFPDSEVYANLPISQWFEEDARVADWLVNEIAKEFSRKEGAAFVSGNGVKQPKGILAYATAATDDDTRAYGTIQHVVSGDAAAIKPDSLIDLLYTLRPEYRSNATWLCNSKTLAAIRKLKDGDGNSMWQPALMQGQPQLLLGYPLLECNDWPDVSENAFPLAVGDFRSAYYILDRTQTLLRDPFTAKPNVLFYARKRVSGALVDSQAVKLLKISA